MRLFTTKELWLAAMTALLLIYWLPERDGGAWWGYDAATNTLIFGGGVWLLLWIIFYIKNDPFE